jgi:hypothetical protein
VAGEVCDLLSGCDVVEGDDAGVASRSEEFGCGGEGYATDGVDEAGEGMCEAAGFVVEDVDGAVFVA